MAPARGDVHVVTRAEIEAAGLVRLGEIVRLARGWDVLTRDGWRWDAVPSGGRPFEAPPEVVVDGVEVRAERLGTLDLDTIPLSLAQIDSVRFREAGVRHGSRPRIEIVTRRPRGALGGGLRAATGGESGDPGPFAYAGEAAANVDRIGHDGTFFIHGRRGDVGVSATLADQVLVGSDPALARRWRLVTRARPPHVDHRGYALRLRDDGGGTRVVADAETGETADVVFIDLLGRELPLDTRRHAARAALSRRARGGRLDVRAAYTVTALASAPNLDGVDLDLERRESMLEVAWTRGEAGEAGLGIEHRRRLLGGRSLPGVLVARADARIEHRRGRLSAGARGEVGAGTRLDGPLIDVVASLGLDAMLAGDARLSLRYTRTPFALARDLWRWLDDGIGEALGPRVDARIAGTPGATRAIGADLAWRTGSRARTLAVSLGAKDLRDAHEAIVVYRYDPETERFEAPATLATGLAGRVLTARVGGALELPIARVRLAGGYRRQWVLDADAPLGAAWARAATDLGFGEIAYHPERNLALTLRLTARGSASWRAYRDVERGSGGRYDAETPAHATLDATVAKWLADRRIVAALRLENLTGAEARTHPIGPTARFAAFASASLALW